MSDENIFADGQTNASGEPVKAAIALPDSVKDLVGPDKKYATPEKALEALVHAQGHISTLESELKALREKDESRAPVDKVYETVQELLKQKTDPSAAPVDEATIVGLIDRQLTANLEIQLAESNKRAVVEALRGKFGDKAQEVYDAKAKELGVGVGFLNDVAKKSPKAALELFGLGAKAPSHVPHSSGTINMGAIDTRPQLPEKPKTVMGGSTQKDLNAMWDYAKAKVMSGQGDT